MTNREKLAADISNRVMTMSYDELEDFLLETRLSDEVDKLVCGWCKTKQGSHCPFPDSDDTGLCPFVEWMEAEAEDEQMG